MGHLLNNLNNPAPSDRHSRISNQRFNHAARIGLRWAPRISVFIRGVGAAASARKPGPYLRQPVCRFGGKRAPGG